MVAALDTLKAQGFGVACITNNVPSGKGAGMARSEALAAEVAAIMARFDHVIESSKVGVRKPDPRIYEMMCETLGADPGAFTSLRSEERRVGKECVRTCRSRCWPNH